MIKPARAAGERTGVSESIGRRQNKTPLGLPQRGFCFSLKSAPRLRGHSLINLVLLLRIPRIVSRIHVFDLERSLALNLHD
jgi:hypothetical protein